MSRASWSEQLMCLELTRLDSRSLRQSSERSSNSAAMINYYFYYYYYYYSYYHYSYSYFHPYHCERTIVL